MNLQVRARTSLEIVSANLSDLMALPDPEAADALTARMAAHDVLERAYHGSYAEKIVIINEFERRHLWRHLIDPEVGEPFPNLTAWLSSGFLGCRRVNMEAHKDIEKLSDVPLHKLIDVPKSNIKELIKLSTAVRNEDSVLDAARTLRRKEFLSKIEEEHPDQHIEGPEMMRFSPGRSWAKDIEKTIAYALDNDIAGSRDEALWRMAETALWQWELERELREKPVRE